MSPEIGSSAPGEEEAEVAADLRESDVAGSAHPIITAAEMAIHLDVRPITALNVPSSVGRRIGNVIAMCAEYGADGGGNRFHSRRVIIQPSFGAKLNSLVSVTRDHGCTDRKARSVTYRV
jgi:hypothetical protein